MENKEKSELLKEVGLTKMSGSFSKLYRLSALAIFGSILISGLSWWRADKVVRDLGKSVIIVDGQGKVLSGQVEEVNEGELQKMKAENIVRIGVDYMYSFSSTNFDSRIELAKNYWGVAKNEVLTSYKNQNVRELVMQNNLTVDIAFKSVKIGFDGNEVIGEVVFEQAFINGTAVKKRTIVANCTFKNVQPSPENSVGMVIEKWIIKSETDEQA